MEIKYRLASTAKAVLGESRNPKDVGDALEKRFGSRQEGLQSSLINKIQRALWDGKGSILTHRDYMFNLRALLSNTGLDLTGQAFHCYFVDSLPASYDIYIMLHDDKTYDVDDLCERITHQA